MIGGVSRRVGTERRFTPLGPSSCVKQEEGLTLIVLLTDFGSSRGPSEYAGILRGVIRGLCPSAVIEDLSHAVLPHSVREGAWILLTSYSFFPQGTIFLALVDPGVGGRRAPVIVKTRRYFMVGPDNGLLYPAADDDGLEGVVVLPIPKGASRTFHGRDIFAPAAARLETGEDYRNLGRAAGLETTLRFHCSGDEGEIVRVDPFGNLVTNIPPTFTGPAHLGRRLTGPELDHFLPVRGTFEEGGEGEAFLVEGSSGTFEIVVKGGSARDRFSIPIGTRISLRESPE